MKMISQAVAGGPQDVRAVKNPSISTALTDDSNERLHFYVTVYIRESLRAIFHCPV